jgi:hypothetical protein
MVVDDFDVDRFAVLPTETDAVLIIDADAILTGALAMKLFETISRRTVQVFKLVRTFKRVEFAPRLGVQIRVDPLSGFASIFALEYILRGSIANPHGGDCAMQRCTRQGTRASSRNARAPGLSFPNPGNSTLNRF